MSELDTIYEIARDYAEGERQVAAEEVKNLDLEQLRKEYVDLMAMVAYYTKLEQMLSANPRMHFDAIRKALKDLDAENILRQAAMAEESGYPLAQTARVKSQPLLSLLSRCTAMLPTSPESR